MISQIARVLRPSAAAAALCASFDAQQRCYKPYFVNTFFLPRPFAWSAMSPYTYCMLELPDAAVPAVAQDRKEC